MKKSFITLGPGHLPCVISLHSLPEGTLSYKVRAKQNNVIRFSRSLGPKVIKLFSCSTKLSMKFKLHEY